MPATLILCVDDQEISLQARQKVLASARHEVLSTTSAEAAMQLFLTSPIELVVMSNSLGGTTGVALAREMKGHKPHVPILLLSGAAEMPLGAEVCDKFLPKMLGPSNLLDTVAALLNSVRRSADDQSSEQQSKRA